MFIHRQWLEDALKENDPTNVQLFLVGTKKDLSVCVHSFYIQSAEAQLIRFLRSCQLPEVEVQTIYWIQKINGILYIIIIIIIIMFCISIVFPSSLCYFLSLLLSTLRLNRKPSNWLRKSKQSTGPCHHWLVGGLIHQINVETGSNKTGCSLLVCKTVL